MEKKSLDLIQFIVGFILALTGGILMFLGILPISIITTGIVGITLIATSKFKLLK